ncbi:MAG: FlgD immunoglobulin-like domain containing protein, partial [Bacteroidota bacterium]|nr:FlgD immunoglobulin-like domain containing protein [Bacteroidota bacterium]
NDGKDDNLLIKYKPEKPGSIMTILIYDIKGKLIRQLASNVLLASENTFTWDGLTDNHQKAAAGIYIVYAFVYTASGETRHFKKATILSSPLKR